MRKTYTDEINHGQSNAVRLALAGVLMQDLQLQAKKKVHDPSVTFADVIEDAKQTLRDDCSDYANACQIIARQKHHKRETIPKGCVKVFANRPHRLHEIFYYNPHDLLIGWKCRIVKVFEGGRVFYAKKLKSYRHKPGADRP